MQNAFKGHSRTSPDSEIGFKMTAPGAGVILEEFRGPGTGSWTFTGEELSIAGMNNGFHQIRLEVSSGDVGPTLLRDCTVEMSSTYEWAV